MFILIKPEELEPEFINSWKLGHIHNPHIDYATNAIHAIFENRDVIIFKFKKYGWFSYNGENGYTITAGPAGVMINITANNN